MWPITLFRERTYNLKVNAYWTELAEKRAWVVIVSGNRHRAALALCVGVCTLTAGPALAIVPDDPGPAAVRFTINSGENIRSISPYIYGSNSSEITNRTFDRSGGNRMTGYNWENNASNAGADWYHHSDYGLANGQANAPPGSAVRGMIPAPRRTDGQR